MGLGTAYANVGFFGIPVTQLAFGPEYLLHQSVLTAMMTILVCTLGVWLLSPSGGGLTGKLRAAFETPLIPAVVLGLALRFLEVELPPVASQPLQLLGAIFTPLALYTLGAQIAAAGSLRLEVLPQSIILALKLAVAPLITLWLCWVMGVPADVTAVLVVAAATPVGVLITIFAAELDAEPEFIATATVITTALCPLTVTAWIIAMRLLA
jgi:predicted permease